MQNIRQKLKTKYRLYHNWHQHKHHNKIHWGVFILFSFFVFALILIIPLHHSLSAWSIPTRLDSSSGAYSSLFYAPNGDLMVFYSIKEGTTEKMVVRIRRFGESIFGEEKFVYNNCSSVGIHYGAGDTIDIAVAAGGIVAILQSIDGGETWVFKKSYSGGNNTNTFPNYNPLYFTENGTDLRLVYGYEYDSRLFGSHGQVYYAKRISDNWDSSGTLIGDGIIAGAYDNNNKACIATDRGIYYSVNNGDDYILNDREEIPERLRSSDAMINNNRIYILHSYNYGMEPNNKFLRFTFSSDYCSNWNYPQTSIIDESSSYFFTPRFTMDGTTMVAVWQHSELPNINKYIQSAISTDGGETWGQVKNILSLSGEENISTYDPIDIASYNRKISLVYALKNSDARNGVYFMEYDLPPNGECIPEETCDYTAPTVPALTANVVSSSQINLSWTGSTDNVGVTGYKIYRDGILRGTIDEGGGTSYSDTGLTASTTYTYAVSAYDAAGNESEKSSSASATTFKSSDLNKDTKVDQQDLDILKQNWSRTDKPVSDINQDGIVDSRDLGIMMSEWGG